MNEQAPASNSGPPSRWPLRWWIGVGLMFLLQLGLIVWLSDPHPPRTRVARPVQELRLVGSGAGPLMALLDPTIFALPHPEGFAGEAWLSAEPQPYPAFHWEEEPGELGLPQADLGTAFTRFVATNRFPVSLQASVPEPQKGEPDWAELFNLAESSSCRVCGQLARRQLLSRWELPSWTNSTLLTNSVVHLLVDASGRPVSAALLPPGCGYRPADAFALETARGARFNSTAGEGPLSNPGQSRGFMWGELVFQWHTVPAPQTNQHPAPAR